MTVHPSTIHGGAKKFFPAPAYEIDHFTAFMLDIEIYLQIPACASEPDGFKVTAAWVIEACGWKGSRLGDAGDHEIHALMLVNQGRVSGEQIWSPACRIRDSATCTLTPGPKPEPGIIAAAAGTGYGESCNGLN